MPHGFSADSYRLETVKVCGMMSVADRDLAADAGADYFGVLMDVGYSPRSLTMDQCRPLFDSSPIPGIISLYNPDAGKVRQIVEELSPFAVQFLGNESPEFLVLLKSTLGCEIWKSLHVPARNYGTIDLEAMNGLAEEYEDSGADAILFTTVDTSTGATRFSTGGVADWGLIRGLVNGRSVPAYLAGGLDAGNVLSALQTVRPEGIDVCSGVESSPGKKDPAKLAAFLEAVAPFRAR